jgi:hypothetical protein
MSYEQSSVIDCSLFIILLFGALLQFLGLILISAGAWKRQKVLFRKGILLLISGTAAAVLICFVLGIRSGLIDHRSRPHGSLAFEDFGYSLCRCDRDFIGKQIRSTLELKPFWQNTSETECS